MEVNMLKMDTCLLKNKDVPWRMIDKEAILVDIKKSESIYFNEMAARIWDCLDGKKTIKEIIKNIRGISDVNEKTVTNDIFEFLENLLEKKLIHD